MRAMSTRNDEPTRASRPFDAGRDGFVPGEGAGLVVLESLEQARGRGARIYAEIVGYGMTADAYHMTAPDPDGDGAARAMTEALAAHGIEEPGIPDPMNVFMSMDVGPKGELTILESTSKPGDHLDVRMLEDCIVALSACPQDLNATNGGKSTDLGVEIIPA